MSDTPFSGLRGGNQLMPARPAAPQTPPVPQAPAPPARILLPLQMRHAHAIMAGDDQATMIRKRDVGGRELAKLAEIANDPEPNRADIAAYIGKLMRTGDVTADEAAQLMTALPNDGAGIRQWAGEMFGNLLNVVTHAHAAYPRDVFPGAAAAEPVPAPEPPEEAPNG